MTKVMPILAFALFAAMTGGSASPAQAGALSPAGETVIDPTITVEAESKGDAEAGKYKRLNGDKVYTSSDNQVDTEKAHIKEYDGPTKFKVDYTIVKDENGDLDTKKSFVRMTATSFTLSGKPAPAKFTTPKIKITKATFNKDGSVESFQFEGVDWYDPNSSGANAVTGVKLTGSIDLNTGEVTYKAVYQVKGNGVIVTYDVNGKIKPPPPAKPAPGAGPGAMPGKPVGAAPIAPDPLIPVGLGFGAILLIGELGSSHSSISP